MGSTFMELRCKYIAIWVNDMGIYKRPDTGKWCVQIRVVGFPTMSKTFARKEDAKKWERFVLADIEAVRANPSIVFDKEKYFRRSAKASRKQPEDDGRPSISWPLRKAINKYLMEEVDKLNGRRQATNRLEMWLRSEFADIPLNKISAQALFDWKTNRTKTVGGKEVPVSASTIRNDMLRLSAIFVIAANPVTKGGWGLTGLQNPIREIKLPPPPEGRQRRLQHGEQTNLFNAIQNGPHADEMLGFIKVALDTCMRKSEILNTTVSEVRRHRDGLVIHKAKTKNGSPREIFLSEIAGEIVEKLSYDKSPGQRLFTIRETQVDYLWRRAKRIAGCDDLRIHDLRHEAISRFADGGMSMGGLAAMSGHKTSQMLLRYINIKECVAREIIRSHGINSAA